MKPPLPLIAVINHALILITEADAWDKASALALVKNLGDNSQYFDKDGRQWEAKIEAKSFRLTLLNRLLARTFYNPTVTIVRHWTQKGNYELSELKKRIIECIDDDDDVLTQWVEAPSLKAKLGECTTFFAVFDMLSSYIFNPDEERLYEEFSPNE